MGVRMLAELGVSADEAALSATYDDNNDEVIREEIKSVDNLLNSLLSPISQNFASPLLPAFLPGTRESHTPQSARVYREDFHTLEGSFRTAPSLDSAAEEMWASRKAAAETIRQLGSQRRVRAADPQWLQGLVFPESPVAIETRNLPAHHM